MTECSIWSPTGEPAVVVSTGRANVQVLIIPEIKQLNKNCAL